MKPVFKITFLRASQRPTYTSRPPSGPRMEPNAEKRQKTLFDMGCIMQSARRARPGHRLGQGA
eukprot:1098565-Pelagomonas_calceolata.AAC.1